MSNLWNAVREQLTAARVTPIVMTVVGAAVAAGTGWLAQHGLNLDPGTTTAAVAAVALGAVGQALHWQKGRREHEARASAIGDELATADVHPDDLVPDEHDLDSEKAKAAEAKRVSKK